MAAAPLFTELTARFGPAKRAESAVYIFFIDMFYAQTPRPKWPACLRPARTRATLCTGAVCRAPLRIQIRYCALTLALHRRALRAGATPEMTAMLAAGKDKNSALYRAAVRIQANFRGYVVRKAYKLYKIGGVVSEILYSPAAFGLDLSVKNMPKPRGRISALTAVVGNSLWLAGGIVEIGSKEITLDDMWCLDLVKLDGWDCVKGNTVGEEMFAADGSSDYETDSGGEGDDA